MRKRCCVRAALLPIFCLSGCFAAQPGLLKEPHYCGYAEPRTETQTSLWDKGLTGDSAGETCIMLFHTHERRFAPGARVCVPLADVQSACSGMSGNVCTAECDGRYVDQLSVPRR